MHELVPEEAIVRSFPQRRRRSSSRLNLQPRSQIVPAFAVGKVEWPAVQVRLDTLEQVRLIYAFAGDVGSGSVRRRIDRIDGKVGRLVYVCL